MVAESGTLADSLTWPWGIEELRPLDKTAVSADTEAIEVWVWRVDRMGVLDVPESTTVLRSSEVEGIDGELLVLEGTVVVFLDLLIAPSIFFLKSKPIFCPTLSKTSLKLALEDFYHCYHFRVFSFPGEINP